MAIGREDGHSCGSGEVSESHGHQGHRVHEGHLLGHAVVWVAGGWLPNELEVQHVWWRQ